MYRLAARSHSIFSLLGRASLGLHLPRRKDDALVPRGRSSSSNGRVIGSHSPSGDPKLAPQSGIILAAFMEIRVSFEAGVPVVTLDGRFDGAGAIGFDAQMAALDTEAVHWVIDLSGVFYLSSLG